MESWASISTLVDPYMLAPNCGESQNFLMQTWWNRCNDPYLSSASWENGFKWAYLFALYNPTNDIELEKLMLMMKVTFTNISTNWGIEYGDCRQNVSKVTMLRYIQSRVWNAPVKWLIRQLGFLKSPYNMIDWSCRRSTLRCLIAKFCFQK